jgi:hypothetical protein
VARLYRPEKTDVMSEPLPDWAGGGSGEQPQTAKEEPNKMSATATKDRQIGTSKMALSGVTKGRVDQPLRVLLYGVEGIGKSSFAAGAPSPIFLGAEDGTATLDVARMPHASSWGDLLEGVNTLIDEDHEYKTLVVDTLDWAEPLCWAAVCNDAGKATIEDFGFGKGYVAAVDRWREMLAALDHLRSTKKMHIVLLAHSLVKLFKNPEGEDFDRYELKLHAKTGGLIKEWADAVLFANYETFAKKDDKTKRVRGLSTGARLIYTQRRAAYDAKNRHDLPDSLPLSWDDFYQGTRARLVAPVSDLIAAVTEVAQALDETIKGHLMKALERDKGDAVKLAALLNKANAAAAKASAKEGV